MANQIHVTPERLKTTASQFESTNSNIKNLTSQMTSIVTSMSGNIWSGEAATAYVAKVQGLQGDINKISRMISEHVTDLQQMANEYERAESTSTSTAQSLKTDVIV